MNKHTNIQKTIKEASSREDAYLTLLKAGHSVSEIEQAYGVIDSSKEDAGKRAVYVVTMIAAVLVGVGVFSFVASNWEYMDKSSKVMLLVATIMASYAAGWYFYNEKKLERTGRSLFFLANIVYGASIFLVAQIFNIQAEWADGHMLWMLGVLCAAYVLRFKELWVSAVLLGVIAITAYPHTVLIGGLTGSVSYFVSSTMLLVVCGVVTGYLGYVVRKDKVTFLS